MRALYTAATGMMAQELNVQVISNNIANVRTTGYKRQRIHFQDLLYEHFRRAGTQTSDQNTQVPAGTFVGSGVKTASTGRVMSQGNLTPTEKQYDVAIRGEGFFRIQMPDGRTAYSRDGSFDLDSQGLLFLFGKRQAVLASPLHNVGQTHLPQIEMLTVEGCLEGDARKVYQAVAHDPLTAAVLSLQEIKDMVAEMLAKNKRYLPTFKKISL